MKILENSAMPYHHGAGPIAVKLLIDEGVEMVITKELGLGIAELLEQHNLEAIHVKTETNVRDAIQQALLTHKQ